MSEAEQRLREELAAVPVSLEDLLRARDAVHALPEQGSDALCRIDALRTLWPELAPLDRARKIQAVDYRLRAMARLVEAGELSGWVHSTGLDAAVLVAEAVWIAAAESPLLWRENSEGPSFDEDAFRARALEVSTVGPGSSNESLFH